MICVYLHIPVKLPLPVPRPKTTSYRKNVTVLAKVEMGFNPNDLNKSTIYCPVWNISQLYLSSSRGEDD